MSNNQGVMESILIHLRKLILGTENGDEEQLKKLVNMACEVSNQIIKIENREYKDIETCDDEDADEESDNPEDYEEV